MIARIGRIGRSFVGAGAYFLQDVDAFTDERVTFTETRNTLTRCAHKALRVMAATTLNTDIIKKRAGRKCGARTNGRVVFQFSISWAPEENLTQEEMVAAVEAAVSHLGLSDHEHVICGHGDRAHPHVHCIVNLINPLTGLKANMWGSKKKIQEWAHDYDPHRSERLTPQRAQNVKRRRSKRRSQYKDPVIGGAFRKAKSLKEFSELLKLEGYRLARGRRLIVVTRSGRIENPRRHLEVSERKRLKAWTRVGGMNKLPPLAEVRTKEGINDNRPCQGRMKKMDPAP